MDTYFILYTYNIISKNKNNRKPKRYDDVNSFVTASGYLNEIK